MMPVTPNLVSTIIPVFNRPQMIISAVESVLQQSYRPIEIIIIDDGSDDETTEVVIGLAKRHQEIITLKQKNAGPGVARETGRQLASGEFIQYLDSDDRLLIDKFKLQVKALKDNIDCDVAYGKTDYQKVGIYQEPSALKLTGKKMETMFPEFMKSRWWSTSTPLFRRTVTDEAGEWLSLINEEDWEYDCRVAALGGKLTYVDDFVSVTYSHDDHLSHNGTVDPVKLRDRCIAREHMFNSAKKSQIQIPDEVMQFFAKAVFLLARECAAQNMSECVKRMLLLANAARGKTTIKQSVFTSIGKLFGWPTAAKVAKALQK